MVGNRYDTILTVIDLILANYYLYFHSYMV